MQRQVDGSEFSKATLVERGSSSQDSQTVQEDRLNQFLMICAMVFLVLSMIFRGFFYLGAVALMVYAYFRMFSRNVNKRSLENQKYLKQEMKVRGFFGKMKRDMAQRKEYHIYKCPGCGQKLRVPRGKGRIAISCRKCGNEFIKKS